MAGRRWRKYMKKQHNKAARQQQPCTSRPAADAEVHELKQALKSAKRTNQTLVSVNTSLRKSAEEFKHMTISWVKEKGQLVNENRGLKRVLGRKYLHAKNEVERLEEVLKAAKTNEKMENERHLTAFKNILHEFQTLRTWWTLKEEKITTELKEMQEKCQDQREVIMKKSKRITRYKRELLALEMYHLQRERSWGKKCKALKVRLREKLADEEEREPHHEEEENISLFPGKEDEQLKCESGDRHAAV
ncbi:uncharacterized protein LOC130166494 [Seriola aureovittata]|uniref:uncharacterized protein LOC130166494 n=1 Tax=Seriola aureovittata TaxID=2871759 RepID=UPI0024BE9133|nr:uncharacterized protein LOC130166494 [Seriola aureovittata]